MSGFIVMFALVKKYQKGAEERRTEKTPSQQFSSNQRRISFYDDHMLIQDCETLSVPKLNIKTMVKQVLARWLRLAFPTYIIILFTLSMYIYIGSGPDFYNVINFNIIAPLKQYWWSIVFFI